MIEADGHKAVYSQDKLLEIHASHGSAAISLPGNISSANPLARICEIIQAIIDQRIIVLNAIRIYTPSKPALPGLDRLSPAHA